MLRDIAAKYYLEQDRNCAESLLLAIRDRYGLELDDSAIKVIGAFGGGMGCERTCGALCGSIGALGKMCIDTVAHASTTLKPRSARMFELFEQKLGTTECKELRAKYVVEGRKCGATVDLCCDAFETLMNEIKAEEDAKSEADK